MIQKAINLARTEDILFLKAANKKVKLEKKRAESLYDRIVFGKFVLPIEANNDQRTNLVERLLFLKNALSGILDDNNKSLARFKSNYLYRDFVFMVLDKILLYIYLPMINQQIEYINETVIRKAGQQYELNRNRIKRPSQYFWIDLSNFLFSPRNQTEIF